jgi:serine/threonine-protein kinase RsbW
MPPSAEQASVSRDRFVVPGRVHELDTARERLLRVLEGVDASPQGVYDAELVLEELFTNVVRYGLRADADSVVSIAFVAQADGLAITIENEGVEFDPRTVPEPERPTCLEEARIGGLGLVLVRRVARRLEYERAGGRNRVTAVLALRPEVS